MYPTPNNAITPKDTNVYDPKAGVVKAPAPVSPSVPTGPTQQQLTLRQEHAEHKASGAPGAGPAGSTASPYYPRYTDAERAAMNTLSAPVTPLTEDEIVAKRTAQAQSQIDALNRMYDAKLLEQRQVNDQRDRSTSSVSTLTGLAGSTEANVAQNKTSTLNQRDIDKINAERGAAIAEIFATIRTNAVEEAAKSRLEARQSAEDILALRTQRQTEASTNLQNLAKAGVTFDGLKASEPESFKYLAETVGEENMKALFTLNRPQESILDKRIEGGKYVIAYQNPLDGNVRIETVDLGLPVGYSKTIDAGDRILAIPDNWDGDPSNLITINKGLTPSQQQDTTPSSSNAIVDANGKPIKLTATQADALTGFDNTKGAAQSALDLLAGGVQTGPIAGLKLQFDKTLGTQDESQLKLEQTLAKLKADFMKAISGAAVSESEAKRLSKFLPEITDQETVIETKLKTLITESERTKANLLTTLGAASLDNADTSSLAAQVRAKGYNYEQMKQDGYDDDEIRKAVGL